MKALGITLRSPKPRNGYVYVYRGETWLEATSDDWEVVTRATNGDEIYVGERRIDGGPCTVWRIADGFIAQPALVVRAIPLKIVSAPGDVCGGSRKTPDGKRCPGCRACS